MTKKDLIDYCKENGIANENDFSFDKNDKWDFCVRINYPYEDIDAVACDFKNSFKEDVFEYFLGHNQIELNIPSIRAELVAEDFCPKIIEKRESNILLKDTNSSTKIWVDYATDYDDVLWWDYNQFIFNKDNSKDVFLYALQRNDKIWYAIDKVMCEEL